MSPGTNAGTGQPIWFKCGRCRALAGAVALTGRTRARRRGGIRMTTRAREYVCECGYRGWSGHVDLERKAARAAGGLGRCES